MGITKWYSNSQSFLIGIRTGIEHVNDSALSIHGIEGSDQDNYKYVLITEDLESDVQEIRKYYNGSEFISQQILE